MKCCGDRGDVCFCRAGCSCMCLDCRCGDWGDPDEPEAEIFWPGRRTGISGGIA